MASLSLTLLGPFTATFNDQPLHKLKNLKAQALLIYLMVEREHPHRRESLFTLLWPGMPEKSARHNLSQTLYALRQTFPAVNSDGSQETVPLIVANRQTVQLNLEASVNSDIHQLDRLLQKLQTHEHMNLADCQPCIQSLAQAVNLYQGDFLAGFYLEDSNQFEDWTVSNREAYRRKILEALQTLTDITTQKREYEQASAYAERQLAIDRLNENAHRQLMEILARSDRRVEALRKYREYVHILDEEMGVSPSSETRALYERIQAEVLPTAPYVHVDAKPEETLTTPHNLPPQPTPFIGREAELADLDRIIADPDIRLITIVAPGGMGKTRLALACAERQLARFPGGDDGYLFSDGIFFVPLEALDNPDQIPSEIATALELDLNPGGMMRAREAAVDPKQLIIDFLQQKRMLVILDNFEQLIDNLLVLTDILQSAPFTKIIVTSRQRLNLHEEQVFPITGLTFPIDEAAQDPCDFTAIQLFQQRAQRVRPDFELTPGDMVYLAPICRLVDGMPLGLELAASWVDMLSIKEVAGELQRNLDFLETDVVNIPERHRSLRAVCDSTWRILGTAERAVFARLSVFRGGFSRTAAQKVAGANIRSLANLVNKSLLQFDPKHERYRIHTYLRQYGNDQLAANPEEESQARDAHSAYFCAELEEHNDTFESGQPYIACERMEKEFANIQAAWDWAVTRGNVERIDQGLDGLCHFLDWNERLYEGLTTCQVVNEMLTNAHTNSTINVHRVDDHNLLEKVHAKVMSWEGNFNYFYDSAQAAILLEECKQKLTKLEKAGYDVRLEMARLLIFKSHNIAQSRKNADLQSSKTLLMESISLLQKTETHWLMFNCLAKLGDHSSALGSHLEAEDWAEQGYSLAKKLQNQYWEVEFINLMGGVAREQGDYDSSIKYYKNAISLADSYHMHRSVADNLRSLGWMFLFLGRLKEAAANLQKKIAIEEKIGIQSQCITLGNLGVAQWLAGDFEYANQSIHTAVDMTQHLTSTDVVYPNVCHIELLAITGRYHDATEKIKRKADWSKNIRISNWSLVSGRLSRILGWVALVADHYPESVEHIEGSIECLQHDDEAVAWSQAYLALAHFRIRERDQARELLIKALSTGIDMQAYIPMVFTLPISLILLAEEDLQFTKQIYTQVQRDPFMAKAQLFQDLVYKHLPDEITSIPVETVVEHNAELREALWETARLVLEKL